MKKQTLEERQAIKAYLLKSDLPKAALDKVLIMDDTTKLKDKTTNVVYTCSEIQLKGCLIENGIRRRYVSYEDLNNYEVSN